MAPRSFARDVLEDREGSIWIASLGVHRMLGRGELTTYDRRSGLPNPVIWCFLWDRAGRLLVGTASASRAERLGMAGGLAGDDIDAMAFLAQPDGEVFLGTSSGFSHYVPRADAPRIEPPPVRITSSAVGAKHDFSAGQRNVLIHDYGDVDDDLVWNLIELEIPKLARSSKESLRRTSPNSVARGSVLQSFLRGLNLISKS